MTITINGTTGIAGVDGSASTPAYQGNDTNTGIFFPAADTIAFGEGGAEVARFNADAQFVAAAGTASLPVLTTTGDLNTGVFYPAADTVAWTTGGSERARIDSSGNLLVGTTTAAARLTVQGVDATASNWAVRINNSAGTDVFRVRNDGYFITGLATQSPYNLTTGSAANVNMDANGGLQRVTSSLKYKRDVQDAVHGLADVLALRPVTYKGKNANDGETVFGGLIAEEVHAAGLTEFVVYAEDGTPDALAYANMVSLLVAAIQELNAKVQTLEAQNAAFEARLAALEAN